MMEHQTSIVLGELLMLTLERMAEGSLATPGNTWMLSKTADTRRKP
jgi:hypothetical protein